MTEELLGYELRADQDGHERSGAFRTDTHDDLVCALGLATELDAGLKRKRAPRALHRPWPVLAGSVPLDAPSPAGTQDDLVTALWLALQDDGPRRAIILGG